jgi:transposase InsO family protein
MGTRKLYGKLEGFMKEHNIRMGRDALFSLLLSNKLLVSKRQRRVRTTQSHHWLRKYPNLIKGLVPASPNHIWVSDITYWRIEPGFYYISFITDAFSHKIVGYHVGESLATVETIQALKMALDGLYRKPKKHHKLIHHSDRGLQYCSHDYVDLLKDRNIKISMTESGGPLDNAVAERINGILKEEYLKFYDVNTIGEACNALEISVKLYNRDRPHNSISNLHPDQVHAFNIKTKKMWKNYYKKREAVSV